MKALFGASLAGLLLLSSVFIVEEGQRSILFQFSKVQRTTDGSVQVFEPGLHFKLPLVEKVRHLDAKVQTLENPGDRFVTSEKKDLLVDSYVKWRISDFGKYYLATQGQLERAETLLRQYINNGLRTEFGSRTIVQIVSGERSALMKNAMEQAAKGAEELGIEVLDVRVKKINLPDSISSNIYQRMRAERIAVAKEHRARGMEEAEKKRSDIDAKVSIMLADAQRNSRSLRGEGDAEAAKIYAGAYGKNADFFTFLRSMEAYRNSFTNKSDVIIVQPDNEFFRLMQGPAK